MKGKKEGPSKEKEIEEPLRQEENKERVISWKPSA